MELIINGKIFKSYDENYLVSEYGDVYSLRNKRILKGDIDKDGYHRVQLYGKNIKIHKLVYLVLCGDIPENLQINHIDDNKENNHYSNLYLGNQKENIQDCINNNHRVGNKFYLKILDKENNSLLEFYPAKDFIPYSGHTCSNGSLSKMFKTDWFKERFKVIEYKRKCNDYR